MVAKAKVLGGAHKQALLLVKNGADVTGYGLAMLLREVERIEPKYVQIGDRMGKYDGAGQLPYFGAIATRAGIEWANTPNGKAKRRKVSP